MIRAFLDRLANLVTIADDALDVWFDEDNEGPMT